MGDIIENRTYFYLTPSVFEVASKNPSNNASKFLLKSVMIKLLHQDKIKPHIVLFPLDEVENIKMEFGNNFDSLLQIGENMFSTEYNPRIRGKANERILYYATNKDGEISEKDIVKVVCANTITEQFFKTQIAEHNFPVKEITIDDALKELEEIEKMLKNGDCYVECPVKNLEIPKETISTDGTGVEEKSKI